MSAEEAEESESQIDINQLDLNKILSLSFNFDLLKVILSNLMSNQQSLEEKISDLKGENVNKEKHIDDIQKELIDLKMTIEKDEARLKELSSRRDTLSQKTYEDNNISKITKKKESSMISPKDSSLKVNLGKPKLNETSEKSKEAELSEKEKLTTKSNKEVVVVEKPAKKGKKKNLYKTEKTGSALDIFQSVNTLSPMENSFVNLSMRNQQIKPGLIYKYAKIYATSSHKTSSSKEKSPKSKDRKKHKYADFDPEVLKKYDELINSLNNEIDQLKSNIEDLKNKDINLENDLHANITQTNERLETIPKLIDDKTFRALSEFQSFVSDKFKESDQKLIKNSEDFISLQEYTTKNTNKLQARCDVLEQQVKDEKAGIFTMKKSITKINEKLPSFLDTLTFSRFKNEIADRLESEFKDVAIESSILKKSIDNIKNQILQILTDTTDHDNIMTLMKKYEVLMPTVLRLEEFQRVMTEKEKRRPVFDPAKYVTVDGFADFRLNLDKLNDSFKREFMYVKNDIEEIKEKYLKSKAGLKDLKALEDSLFEKLDDFRDSVISKFVEKQWVNKQLKILECSTKNMVDEVEKKNENKQDSWLLTKKPMGHLCASCEAYIGDIQKLAQQSKYIPWNKYPTKDPNDKLYRIGAGFSKMLQMVPGGKKLVKEQSANDLRSMQLQEMNQSLLVDESLMSNGDNLPKITNALKKSPSQAMLQVEARTEESKKKISEAAKETTTNGNKDNKIDSLKDDAINAGPRIMRVYKKTPQGNGGVTGEAS